MRDRFFIVAALAATTSLAACSGGGGGSSPAPIGSSAPTAPSGTADSAIADANALGAPVKDFADFEKAGDLGGAPAAALRRANVATGACNNGVEFFAPDRAGDASSTETIVFYDAACTSQARDTVRVYAATGSTSENVNVTVSFYAPNNTTPIATSSDLQSLRNATFNANGFPIVADGYDLTASDTLNIANAKTIASSRELVMEPATNGSSTFCSDSAGYNATGFARTGKTYGWQGGELTGGTRVVNADGSVTWSSTRAGTSIVGAIGSLSIVAGAQNTACPIATPAFTIAGGSAFGSYSIPLVATYAHGMLTSLSITSASLANGDTLSVTTNAAQPPSSNQFVTGIVSNAGTQVATFAVDAFGDGTLTVTSTGGQFVITDWHVVR